MSEMYVTTPDVKKTIDDYDISFDSGAGIPLSIDLEAGDTITFDDKAILIHLVAKPNQYDPSKTLPASDLTIFTPHIISIEHRVREVVQPSPEQQAQLGQTIKELAGGSIH